MLEIPCTLISSSVTQDLDSELVHAAGRHELVEHDREERQLIYAQERATPKDCDRIDWKLLTDLPINSGAEAIDKIRWYSLRWKNENFLQILKSGCRREESRLRTAERLVRIVAVCCILSWRISWMTMINRTQPEASPTLTAPAIRHP